MNVDEHFVSNSDRSFSVLAHQENVLGNHNVVVDSNKNTNGVVSPFEFADNASPPRRKKFALVFFFFSVLLVVGVVTNGFAIFFSTKNKIEIGQLENSFQKEKIGNDERYKSWMNQSVVQMRLLRGEVNQLEARVHCSNRSATQWQPNGRTMLDGLQQPAALVIDGEAMVYTTDTKNDRLFVKRGDTHRWHSVKTPTDVVLDKDTNTLFVCAKGDRAVMRWSPPSSTAGDVFLDRIDCNGLALDPRGFLYVSVGNEV